MGARGGGFGLALGVHTTVAFKVGPSSRVRVTVNGNRMNFPPSLVMARRLLHKFGVRGDLDVRHAIQVPIGTGFGTSAASAMGLALAFSKLVDQPMSLVEAGLETHIVELKCRTGLNSEIGLLGGGIVIVRKEGAPGVGQIDLIPVPEDLNLVCVVRGPYYTPQVLSHSRRLARIEQDGDHFLKLILKKPTLENFMHQAHQFALQTGLADRYVQKMLTAAQSLGVAGVAQNMVGRAIHMTVDEDTAPRLMRRFREQFPGTRVFQSRIFGGVRLE